MWNFFFLHLSSCFNTKAAQDSLLWEDWNHYLFNWNLNVTADKPPQWYVCKHSPKVLLSFFSLKVFFIHLLQPTKCDVFGIRVCFHRIKTITFCSWKNPNNPVHLRVFFQALHLLWLICTSINTELPDILHFIWGYYANYCSGGLMQICL